MNVDSLIAITATDLANRVLQPQLASEMMNTPEDVARYLLELINQRESLFSDKQLVMISKATELENQVIQREVEAEVDRLIGGATDSETLTSVANKLRTQVLEVNQDQVLSSATRPQTKKTPTPVIGPTELSEEDLEDYS